DAAFRRVYASLLSAQGFTVDQADDRPSARGAFQAAAYGVVLLDMMLPPDGTTKAGLEQLKALLEARPEAKVIVVSGACGTHVMLKAIRDGAHDFITKPADPDVLLTIVERAARRFELERQLAELRQSLTEARPSGSLIGNSSQFMAAIDLARRVAPSPLPVLI